MSFVNVKKFAEICLVQRKLFKSSASVLEPYKYRYQIITGIKHLLMPTKFEQKIIFEKKMVLMTKIHMYGTSTGLFAINYNFCCVQKVLSGILFFIYD